MLRGKPAGWVFRRSLWAAWAFIPTLHGFSFLIAGRRLSDRRWMGLGIVLLLPWIPVAVAAALGQEDGDPFYDAAIGILAAGWFVSLCLIYFAWRQYVDEYLSGTKEQPPAPAAFQAEQAPGSAPATEPAAKPAPEPPAATSPVVSEPEPPMTTPIEPVDLNMASAEDLARLPGMSANRAAQAVALRKTRGPFRSLEDFGLAIELQPHEIERLRSRARISTPERPRRGRIVDV